MNYLNFIEQDKYCKENNIPEGVGCSNCPTIDKEHCADALRNLTGKLIDSIGTPVFNIISKELGENYGIMPYHQLAIFKGILEFPN